MVYLQATGETSLDSDVVLDTPGPGNNKAFGHCRLDYETLTGLCTFSGGTGKFRGFTASAPVSWKDPGSSRRCDVYTSRF